MVLFSNAPWISQMENFRKPSSASSSLAVRFEDQTSGEMRSRGGPDLKDSQAYTPEFGQALAGLFDANRKQWRRQRLELPRACKCTTAACPTAEELLTEPHSQMLDDIWDDAELLPLMRSLQCRALSAAPDILNDVIDVDATS